MLQNRPNNREGPQKQHDGSEEITKEEHDSNALDNKTYEWVLSQDQRDASKEKKSRLDLGGPSKEVDGTRWPND